ncbi:hypothetical protein COBT_003414, partial [Conglomerata obtusa]
TLTHTNFCTIAFALTNKKKNLIPTCLYLYGDPCTEKDETVSVITSNLGLYPHTIANEWKFYER